ncbi:hypothetical protein V5F77_00960 [Xanthobacter sp. DSM 24535]|uniref:hypothetical protein n=1 Tax=Roseixanthobacter psychrophilus TaxID=3119917 RepID=UPI00372A0040
MTHVQSSSHASSFKGSTRPLADRDAPEPFGSAEWGSLGGNARLLPLAFGPVRNAMPVCARFLLVAFALACIIAMVR